MTKAQWIVTGLAVILLLGLYLGFDIKPSSREKVDQSRALVAQSTDVQSLLKQARAELPSPASSGILALELDLDKAGADTTARVEALKRLSGQWYELGYPAISGFYAEEVAGLEKGEEAWSVAGTTYALCLQQSREEKVRQYCFSRAVNAFENAISLNPSNADHKINLALTYVEAPVQGEEMKGIMMLRDLNQEQPDNAAALFHLGRLAIQTNQFDKAVERLTRVLELDPENKQAPCLLQIAYEGLGDQARSAEFASRCKQ